MPLRSVPSASIVPLQSMRAFVVSAATKHRSGDRLPQQIIGERNIHLNAMIQVVLDRVPRHPDGVLPCLPIAGSMRLDDVSLHAQEGAPP